MFFDIFYALFTIYLVIFMGFKYGNWIKDISNECVHPPDRVQKRVRYAACFSNSKEFIFISVQFLLLLFSTLISTEFIMVFTCTIVLSPWLRSDGCFTLIYFYGLEPKITDLINSFLLIRFLLLLLLFGLHFFPSLSSFVV